MTYIVYGKPDNAVPPCTYCVQSKALLDQKGIPYEYVEIGTDISREDLIDLMVVYSGRPPRTVPQIVFRKEDGTIEYIGGYTELAGRVNNAS